MHCGRVRIATHRDVAQLVALNRAAYPDLVEDGVVFDAPQIRAQQAVFPEGQLIIEREGAIVGAIASLIVPSAIAARAHTWSEITSHGTFARHDANADALYLADVYSAPSARGLGVGAALYEALFGICKRRELAMVVAGGRLWGYHEVATTLSPEAYVDQVIQGKRKDRVLTSQLRAGFAVRGLLSGYLDDWRSASYATHLFWDNPLTKWNDARAPRLPHGDERSEAQSTSPSARSA